MARVGKLENRGQVITKVEVVIGRSLFLRDAEKPPNSRNSYRLGAGTYILEKIRNPFSHRAGFWFVLPGTMIGYPDDLFYALAKPNAGQYKITLSELTCRTS